MNIKINELHKPSELHLSLTRREPQSEVFVGAGFELQNLVSNVLCCPFARLVVVVKDDELHGPREVRSVRKERGACINFSLEAIRVKTLAIRL